MDENGIRTKVRGKPGKFSASEANKTGNIKKVGSEECWKPMIC